MYNLISSPTPKDIADYRERGQKYYTACTPKHIIYHYYTYTYCNTFGAVDKSRVYLCTAIPIGPRVEKINKKAKNPVRTYGVLACNVTATARRINYRTLCVSACEKVRDFEDSAGQTTDL